ncbi:MAG: NUDIX hydrolase [Acidimicrobiaceae bacterium]|nr:NUDIX hydrolase [Acidimicrobiaceae bacterium]MCY3645083.1 NUDIX hydrolase [Acidimicrobiaceae bacterium]MDE0493530.1 NUDIX hydrolase [Acidimicrobiaceae bacterium]MDE0667288.1 NUDIX hydrolase [Acidimicrobiaceae bacterium]
MTPLSASPRAAADRSGTASAAGAFRKVTEREIHAGRVVRLTESVFATPDGGRMTRDVVHHRGAVAVVAVDGDDVVLLRQYRTPVEGELLEIPAGTRDVGGEDPAGTARRELAEEAGLACESLEELGTFFNSPGFCDELSHVFLATGLSEVPREPDGAEEEWMTIERVGLDEAIEMIDQGQIRDAKTIIGLLLAQRRLEG